MTLDQLYKKGAKKELLQVLGDCTYKEIKVPKHVKVPDGDSLRVNIEWDFGTMIMDCTPKVIHFESLELDTPGEGWLSHLCTVLASVFYEWGVETVKAEIHDPNSWELFKRVGFTGGPVTMQAALRPDSPMRQYGDWKNKKGPEPDYHRWAAWA